MEGANEGIDCLNFLEGFDAEKTVNSVSYWCILIREYLLVFLQAFEVNCDHDLWLKMVEDWQRISILMANCSF